MNRDIFQGMWKELKGQLKKLWGKLAGSGSARASGRLQQWSGTIQRHYGLSKHEMRREVHAFWRRTKK